MEHFFDKGYEVILVTDNRGNHFVQKKTEFRALWSKSLFLQTKFIKVF